MQQENSTQLATLDQIKAVKLEKLNQLASVHKLAGRSKMNAEKLS